MYCLPTFLNRNTTAPVWRREQRTEKVERLLFILFGFERRVYRASSQRTRTTIFCWLFAIRCILCAEQIHTRAAFHGWMWMGKGSNEKTNIPSTHNPEFHVVDWLSVGRRRRVASSPRRPLSASFSRCFVNGLWGNHVGEVRVLFVFAFQKMDIWISRGNMCT